MYQSSLGTGFDIGAKIDIMHININQNFPQQSRGQFKTFTTRTFHSYSHPTDFGNMQHSNLLFWKTLCKKLYFWGQITNTEEKHSTL